MPTATVTNRELKNKDTEIDLTVPTYKESHGKLMTTVEYHVVVVSKLQFFKTPKHRESDVVQYMVPHKLQDFEALKKKLETKYAGTMFPPLPKMALLIDEHVLQERRNRLDDFMRFLAATPKLCSCAVLLEFLGVSAIKAGKFRKGEVKSTENEEEDLFAENQEKSEQEESDGGAKTSNLFDDIEEEDTDLFTTKDQDTTEDLFSVPAPNFAASAPKSKADPLDIQLFTEPDLGGGLTAEEEDLFVLPSAKTEKPTSPLFELEDNSDLLNIEDDLDSLLTMSTKPKPKPKPAIATKPKPTIAAKPKPQPVPKPRITKPKPAEKTDGLFSKPNPAEKTDDLFSKPNPAEKTDDLFCRPNPAEKTDDLFSKPKSAEKTKDLFSKPKTADDTDDLFSLEVDKPTSSMDNDDILKYIQDNAAQSDDTLNLF